MRGVVLATMGAVGLLGLLGQPALAQQAHPRPAASAQRILAVDPADRTLGRADAPVTLTAYLSTVCSHCAEWHERDFPEIKRRLVDTGRVRIVWRDLPTNPPEVAFAGAVVARCAAPARYDDALGALFSGQAVYLPTGNVVGWLRSAAEASGLAIEDAQACLRDESRYTEIETRAQQAASFGVTGTPTLFLNGVLTYARTADEIEAAIAARPAPGG